MTAEEDNQETLTKLEEMTPRQIVEELDRYVISQHKAKRALALASRDRIRRQKLPASIAEEVRPRNLILIGSTGVGKTELARRLARLSRAPFVKVEASKFTEVGYVGQDVDTIVQYLADVSVEMVRQEKASQVEKKAEENAENRLLEILVPKRRSKKTKASAAEMPRKAERKDVPKSREQLRTELRNGRLNHRTVELEVQERFYPSMEFLPLLPEEEGDLQFRDVLTAFLGTRTQKRKMKVDEAIDYLVSEEESRLIDMNQVTREALNRVEQSGIVFVDELDKVAGREYGHGPDVSREGVQRDILPLIEGTTIATRYGMVRTDNILFVAAGAFHTSKPSDLIPELQGRFPVRVEMDSLTEEDFVRILKEPRNALIKQYTALLSTEEIDLEFTDEAISEIAHSAWLANEVAENIGARRLHTVMEALLEEISFKASGKKREKVRIDRDYVQRQLTQIVKDSDLSKYIL
jgi:ATP-dependent HslUV protease ATP-binding subunit HslU